MKRYFEVFHAENTFTVVGEDRAQHMTAQLHHMGKDAVGYREISADDYRAKVQQTLKAIAR